jgi:hypothetical protein
MSRPPPLPRAPEFLGRSPASFVVGNAAGPSGKYFGYSSSVPLACPGECETARNSVVQRERKGAQIPTFDQDIRPLSSSANHSDMMPDQIGKREVTGSTPVPTTGHPLTFHLR